MILDHPLTEEQRRSSCRNYNLYSLVNGASYMCLGETVLTLLAIKVMAPNFVLAAIGAMLQLGFLMLPLGIFRTAKVGAARAVADCWVSRNISALLVACAAPLSLVSSHGAWALILIGSFLFYGFRAAGVVMGQPLIGDFTTEKERAKLLGDSTAYFYLLGVVSLVVITLLLKWNDSLWVLVGIIVVGASLGITASTFFRNIHETSAIRESARKPLFRQMNVCWSNPALRRQIYAGFVFNVTKILIFAMTMTAAKRALGISDSLAVIYSVIQFAVSIVGAKLYATISNRLGTLLHAILDYLLMIPLCGFWLLIPDNLPDIWMMILLAIPFFFCGLYELTYVNIMTQCFLEVIEEDQRVVGSMFVNILTGVTAGLFAMGIAAIVLYWAEAYFDSGLPMFRAYFAVCGCFMAFGIIFIRRLKA